MELGVIGLILRVCSMIWLSGKGGSVLGLTNLQLSGVDNLFDTEYSPLAVASRMSSA